MPKRTTLFQRAVYYIRTHLKDATTEEVTESQMLTDSATGEEREVDVVLTGRIGPYPLIVSIECNERGRKAGTPWVEGMHAKHATLPTKELVLVSQAGFTKPALQKAEYLGHVTVAPDDPTEEKLSKVISDAKRLFIAAFDIAIDQTYFDLAPQGNFKGGIVPCDDDYSIFTEDGEKTGNVAGLLDGLTQAIENSLTEKPLTVGYSQFQWVMRPDDSSTKFFLRSETPTVRLLEITRIIVVGRVRIQQSHIDLTPSILEGVSHSYGETEIAGQHATAFMTAVAQGKAQVSVNISGKPDFPPTEISK